MKKYVVVDGAVTSHAAQYEEIFETKEEALSSADRSWGYLTEKEKRSRDYFYIAYAEVDDDGIVDLDTAITIKQYK